jgi:hypothetical protein
VAAPEPTFVGGCDLKVQLMWQRVDAHTGPYFDLELVCGVPDFQGADTNEHEMVVYHYRACQPRSTHKFH